MYTCKAGDTRAKVRGKALYHRPRKNKVCPEKEYGSRFSIIKSQNPA